MKAFLFALLCVNFATFSVSAAGLDGSDNFIVYTPSEATLSQENEFAAAVVSKAEEFRKEVAETWLGQELPKGAGPTIIYVEFSGLEDSGLTWGKDSPDRTHHLMWLTTSRDRAVGSTLRHEITHTVLATRFPHPNRLPEWVEEGIATRYDDDARQDTRKQIVKFWVRTENFPNLAELFVASDLKSADQHSYAMAASLVGFLLERGDAATVIRFAENGQRRGWDAALQSCYGISSVAELQSLWRDWLTSNSDGA